MSERITNHDLEILVKEINLETGSPTEGNKPNQYILAGAYGGNKLERICSDGHGVHSITSGFVSKKELYNLMQAILTGLRMRKG